MLTKDVLLSSRQADYVLSIGQFLCFVYLPLFDLFNFFIIDLPRPLRTVIWIIIFKSLMRNAYTEPVCLEHLRASK